MIKTIIFIFIIFLSNFTYGQATLKLQVLDNDDKKLQVPLAFIEIKGKNTLIKTQADFDGICTIQLAKGEYMIEAHMPGYYTLDNHKIIISTELTTEKIFLRPIPISEVKESAPIKWKYFCIFEDSIAYKYKQKKKDKK